MTVVGLLGFVGLAVAWTFLAWRVKVERGYVGITPQRRALLRFVAAMKRVEIALAEALLPIVRAATKQLAAWNEAFERLPPDTSAELWSATGPREAP